MTGSVRISKERQVITYCDFWKTSRFLLENGERDAQGSYYQFLGSLVFSAFAFEAFLNHIGEHLFSSWPELERKLSHRAKLALIAERLNFTVNHDRQPWQTIPKLFGFRDKVAHGKSEMLRLEKVVPHDHYEELMHEFMFTDWQKFANQRNASDVRKHLEEIMAKIHDLADIEGDVLFSSGPQFGSATLIQSGEAGR